MAKSVAGSEVKGTFQAVCDPMNLKIVGGLVAYLFLDSKKRASRDILVHRELFDACRTILDCVALLIANDIGPDLFG